ELTNISNVLSISKTLNTPNTLRITRSSTINIGLDKRIAKGFASIISNIYDVQTQMIVMIQDIQKKINEMYIDWKVIRFGSHMENDTKWID
ncbi:8262_t:CDS:2, partial [Funneliformis caledonium]